MEQPFSHEIPVDGVSPQDFTAQEFTNYRENTPNPLAAEMSSTITHSQNPEKNITRQQRILERLPPDFLVELKAHLFDAHLRAEKFGNEITDDFDGLQLRGKLFELLVQYDEELSPTPTALTVEMLSLIENPDRYRLKKVVGYIRHPDLAYVKVNERGQVVIQGFGEIKSGALNDRAIIQLEEFEESIQAVQNAVNDRAETKQLTKLGLTNLANRRDQMHELNQKGRLIEIDHQSFERVLIIPAGKKANIELLGRDKHGAPLKKDADWVRRFEAVMKKVTVKNAAFSNDEIAVLADYLLKKIDNEAISTLM